MRSGRAKSSKRSGRSERSGRLKGRGGTGVRGHDWTKSGFLEHNDHGGMNLLLLMRSGRSKGPGGFVGGMTLVLLIRSVWSGMVREGSI